MDIPRLALPALLAAFVLIGSAQPVSAQPAPAAPMCNAAPPVASQPEVLSDPEVARVIADLPARIEAARAAAGVASVAVGVVHDQDVLLAAGFGCADVERGIAATPRTLYRIASVTKVFEATLTMQLRDAGLIGLDDPVSTHVPAVYYRSPDGAIVSPTFRQLASHTAGLPRVVPSGLTSTAQLFRRLEGITAISQPGTSYAYSNLGFVTLGQADAVIAGQPYHDEIRERILAPLRMNSSGYGPDAIDRSRLAVGYRSLRQTPDGITGPAASYADTFPPAGTLFSTVEDMTRFISLHFRDQPVGGDQILAHESIEEMWQPVAPTGGGGSVGLGWHIRPYGPYRLISKNGGQDGFVSLVQMIPELKLGVVVFVNMSPEAARGPASPAAITRMILDTLVQT